MVSKLMTKSIDNERSFIENTTFTKIKFPHDYGRKLLELLASTEELKERFMTEFYNENYLMMSIINFKRKLINKKSSGSQPSAQELKNISYTNNYTLLQEKLQVLFLDIIEIEEIKVLCRHINNGFDIQNLLDWNIENPNTRIIEGFHKFKIY